jgi:protein-disulfide isomerase-like protein with CxxC motif
MSLDILRITDSGCPWAYSAEPALSVLRHRYRDQINWKLAMIGLAESSDVYVNKGFTPTLIATMAPKFSRRFGMPMSAAVKARPWGTWPACKTVVATRLHQPDLEASAHRALQVAWFTTTDELDTWDALRSTLSTVKGLDAAAIVEAAENDAAVAEAFAADMAVARSAGGSPTEAQGKHAMDGDAARYTAPSLLMQAADGRKLEAGGFQPVEAYDVIIANADPTLKRHEPGSITDILERSPWGLCPAEVAAISAPSLEEPDVAAVETELVELAAKGEIERIPAGNSAFFSI